MGRFFIILSVIFCGLFLLHGEDLRFDETLSGWSRSKKDDISLDGDFSGEPAVRLKDGARMIRTFDLEPDSIYELSFYVKGRDIPSGKNDGARVMVNGGKIWQRFTSDAKKSRPETGTFDWRKGRKIIDTSIYNSGEIRIYLPRCYDENTDRRYPVIYFSDGQNVFQPGGPFGCWNAETAADREIRGGRMREAILVAVPCRETPVPIEGAPADTGRLWEYLPSTDILMTTTLQGLGAKYADFLINNVKPTLDYNFRTLSDRLNTVHIGSSAGGLLSLYLGTVYGDVFGLVAPMSGVYTADYIPNFRQWCFDNRDAVARPKRIWLDTGTEETNVEGQNLYDSNWDALTLLLYAGHVPNKSLHYGVYSGWAGEHNEPAWAARIADVYDFLLPVTDEFNPVNRPEIKIDGMKMEFPLYGGATYTVMRATNLLDHASAQSVWTTTNAVDRPWTNVSYTVEHPGFYWIVGE